MPACMRMMLMLPSHEFSTIMPCNRQFARQSPMSTFPFMCVRALQEKVTEQQLV